MEENTTTPPRSVKVITSQIAEAPLQNKISLSTWQKLVYPKLAKIPSIIDSVLVKIPSINASNIQTVELSSHLKSIKNYIHNSKIEVSNVSRIQDKCSEEWNEFNTQVSQIIDIDENKNIIDFCTTQTDSLSMILNAIHSAFDKNQDQNFIVNGKKVNRKTILSQLQVIDEKFAEVKRKLAEDLNGIQTTLKGLHRIVSESSIVFISCPSSRNENQLYQNRLKQGITCMIQYIQSSNEAIEARQRFKIVIKETSKEMQEYFSQALKEEIKMNQIQILEEKEELTNVTSSITNNDISNINVDSASTTQKQKNKEVRKNPQIVKSHSAPKHTPVSRPKLYEERRRVSAVGSLRAKPSTQKA